MYDFHAETRNYSISLAFIASSFRVTEEDWLSETDLYVPPSFFWMFSLLLKELLFISSPEPKAHGELIGYSWSGVRPSVRRPSSVVNNYKHLLLWNRLANQSQIFCEASLGKGNESLFAASGSHDQDGRHAHIW